jgi:hypothetical protein
MRVCVCVCMRACACEEDELQRASGGHRVKCALRSCWAPHGGTQYISLYISRWEGACTRVHVFRPSISDGSFAAGLSYTSLYTYIYIYIYIDACRSAPVVGPRSFVPVGHLKPCSKGSQRTHACTHTHTERVCVCVRVPCAGNKNQDYCPFVLVWWWAFLARAPSKTWLQNTKRAVEHARAVWFIGCIYIYTLCTLLRRVCVRHAKIWGGPPTRP